VIIARVPEGLRVVLQTDHQDQCRLMADEWGNADFARPHPWAPVVRAAGCHDEGWREWEATPRVLPAGEPQGFAQMEPEQHAAIHRRSIATAMSLDPRTGLLVSMHGAGLSLRRLGLDGRMPHVADRPDPIRDLIHDQAVLQRRVRAGVGEGTAIAGWSWDCYRLLQAWDLLSLYLTWRGLVGGDSWTLRRVPRSIGDEAGVDLAVTPVDDMTCALDPWPFRRARIEAPVRGRIIPDRPYDDHDALRAALEDAPWRVVEHRVVPFGS